LVARDGYCLIMAWQTKVTMIDDLDGENEAVQTVAFSLDSVSYEPGSTGQLWMMSFLVLCGVGGRLVGSGRVCPAGLPAYPGSMVVGGLGMGFR